MFARKAVEFIELAQREEGGGLRTAAVRRAQRASMWSVARLVDGNNARSKSDNLRRPSHLALEPAAVLTMARWSNCSCNVDHE